jgi:phenylacetate-CoA ligase
LAKEVLRLGRNDLKMSVAITDAEELFDYQRKAISEAFQCPVCETYGMNEMVAGASECPMGTMHLWPEAGWIEVMENGSDVPAGQTGELVCTGLINADMPLIRYNVGDRGRLQQDRACGCGRTLPALVGLDGRADDVLYTVDGRAIGRLCTVIQGDLSVYEAQLVQEQLDLIRVKYVPTPEFTHRDADAIANRLRTCMGDVNVLFEQVDRIERGPNGKFRTVVCNLRRRQLESLVC